MNPAFLPAVPLGIRIREIRHELHLSQQDVAHLAQMDPSNYGKVERGQSNPSLDTLTRIATALDTTVADLVTYITAEHVPEKDRIVTARDLIEARLAAHTAAQSDTGAT